MRATLLELSPTPSARPRSLTRVKQLSRRGRNTSPRELFLLASRRDDVINFISKVSVTRQESAAETHGEVAARHISKPIGWAVVRRLQGERAAGRGAEAIAPEPPAPSLASPSNEVFPGFHTQRNRRLPSSGRSCHS